MTQTNKNDDDKMNRDWSFDVNLSGVAAPSGLSGKDIVLPEGFYAAKLTDMYENPEKPGRIIIKCTVAEGPFKGLVRTTGLNVPTSTDDKVRHYWRALAESVGHSATELDAGAISLSPGSFVNRDVFFRYRPKDEAANRKYEDMIFLAQAAWGEQKKLFASMTITTTAATAVSDEASAPAVSNQTVTKDALLKKLGVS